jgi:hypothetical protein
MILAQLLARKLAVAADYNDKKTKSYTITATPDVLERFENFMRHLQYCSGVGHSTDVVMSIDGDGADRFKVKPDLGKPTRKVDEGKYPGPERP